jgi:hypothetical protein
VSRDIRLFAAVFFAVSCVCVAVSEAQYVRVVAKAADIRFGPDPTSELVTRAENGELFHVKGTKGDWFEISMFSGEYRYIQRSQAQPTAQAPPLPADSTVRRSACIEIVKAQDRAVSEAEARFPTTFHAKSTLNACSTIATSCRFFASTASRLLAMQHSWSSARRTGG